VYLRDNYIHDDDGTHCIVLRGYIVFEKVNTQN